MFCTCSRTFSISFFSCNPSRVISTSLLLEQTVFASLRGQFGGLWVGYGQADKGKDAKANKKKRNGLGMHFKFAIKPERSPDLYLCAYGHGSLKPKHKFGECVIDFGKLPWNTPKEMELQLSCRNEEEHASVLVTVEKRRAGYKPYHAKKEKRTELQRIVNNSGLFVDYVPPTVMAQ